MGPKRIVIFIFAATSIFPLAPVKADDKVTEVVQTSLADSSWRVTGLVYVGVDPFQLMLAPGIEYKHVYHHNQSPLWDDLHVKAGLSVLGSPIAPGVQLDLEWMPLVPVILRARYALMFFTGMSLGTGPGLSFGSADDPLDADSLADREGEEETEIVQRATLSLTFRAQLWRFFALNEVELAGWYVPGDSDHFWYEHYYDSMVARGKVDGTLTNKSALLFQGWQGKGAARLLLGATNEYNLALRTGIDRDRVGGIVIFTPADRLLGMDQPTIMVSAGANVHHRHRQEDVWVQAALSLGWDL